VTAVRRSRGLTRATSERASVGLAAGDQDLDDVATDLALDGFRDFSRHVRLERCRDATRLPAGGTSRKLEHDGRRARGRELLPGSEHLGPFDIQAKAYGGDDRHLVLAMAQSTSP